MRNASLALLLVITVCVATLTLWIPAYWPVALFEISVLLIAGATICSLGACLRTALPTPCSH